jgi:hypothetical protein
MRPLARQAAGERVRGTDGDRPAVGQGTGASGREGRHGSRGLKDVAMGDGE